MIKNGADSRSICLASFFAARGAVTGAVGAVVGGFMHGLGDAVGSMLQGGNSYIGTVVHVAAHGAASGGMSEAMGGSFKDGFIGGVIGSVIGGFSEAHFDNSLSGIMAKATIAGVSGGLASVATGGKFGHAAYSAAFFYLFNTASKVLISREQAIESGIASRKYYGYSDPRIARDGLGAPDGASMAWWSDKFTSAGRTLSDFFTRGLTSNLEALITQDDLMLEPSTASQVRGETAIHGNDASSMKPQVIYKLVERGTGKLLKWGITSLKNPISRYTTKFYNQLNAEMIKVKTVIGRRLGLDVERSLIEKEPGPLNKEKWKK